MKLAIFDFDGTLFLQDTLPYLLKLWRHLKYPRSRLMRAYISMGGLYVRYKLHLYSTRQRGRGAIAAMNKFVRMFAGMSTQQIEGFFNKCAGEITERLNKEVVDEIKSVKELGCHTVLLSGCFEYLLEAIGKFIGIDTVIGTRINYLDGAIDLRVPLDVVYGTEKISKLSAHFEKEEIDWVGSFSYADNISDLHVLEMVGNPVAVNPDSELKKKAEESGWRIIVSEKS